MHEAMFYDREEDNRVRCRLCRHHCLIGDGGYGICRVRRNLGGVLQSLCYGQLVAANADPVEKKPLFHYRPGTFTFSIATPGCNFRCRHCQNYSIAQVEPADLPTGPERSPAEVVAAARRQRCDSLSYTYAEPTIFYEFAMATARLAKEAGLGNIFVTNGYIEDEPLAAIAPYLDAANIDLKGFTEKHYREVCGATLAGVLATIRSYRRHGIWLEITTLVIPGLNDSDEELARIAGFIRDETGAETPWHVSRFYPTYRLTDRPATPAATVERAREIGLAAGLKHVYTGNLPAGGGEDTACLGCGATVVARSGYTVRSNRLQDGRCPDCGGAVAGCW